jgi:hypothetical protein
MDQRGTKSDDLDPSSCKFMHSHALSPAELTSGGNGPLHYERGMYSAKAADATEASSVWIGVVQHQAGQSHGLYSSPKGYNKSAPGNARGHDRDKYASPERARHDGIPRTQPETLNPKRIVKSAVSPRLFLQIGESFDL